MELTEQNNKTASTTQLATLLATPGAVWVVRAGSVHLFLARVNAEGETLARHPFCRVDAEEVLFSLHGAAPAGWSVVAQATAETQVEQLAQHEVLPEHRPLWLAKLRHAAGLDEDATEPAAEQLRETHQKILVAAIELQRQRDEAERARIAKRHAEDQRHIDDSFRRLASTLVSERKRLDFNPDVDDPLFMACEALGHEAGIHFTPPLEMLRHLPMRDPLAAIARASSVRYRKVALSARIWSSAEQPFLARREADGAPLAFLPNGRTWIQRLRSCNANEHAGDGGDHAIAGALRHGLLQAVPGAAARRARCACVRSARQRARSVGAGADGFAGRIAGDGGTAADVQTYSTT